MLKKTNTANNAKKGTGNATKFAMPVTATIDGVNIVGFATNSDKKRIILNPDEKDKNKIKYLLTFAINDRRKEVSDENKLETSYIRVSATGKQLSYLADEVGLKFGEYAGYIARLSVRFNPKALEKDQSGIMSLVNISVLDKNEDGTWAHTGWLIETSAPAQTKKEEPKKKTPTTKKKAEPVEEVEETTEEAEEEAPDTFDVNVEDEDLPF